MKLIIIFCAIFISMQTFAQIQRTPLVAHFSKDSIEVNGNFGAQKNNKNKIFDELGLTKEQRLKLKDIRKGAKAKKEEIENNDKISDEQQRSQLRSIRKETDEAIKKILTDDQWKKFLEDRDERKKHDL